MTLTDAGPHTDDELLDRLRAATIGRYDIYAELGRGGMAAVFLALDLALGRKVAIKAMLPEIAVDAGAVERFRREARFAASLSHPSIVPIYTVGDSVNPPFFVMKFVDGRALDSVLRSEGAQSPALVQAVLQQVGGALEYAHRRNITHRDVKPANIMLDDDGWILLTDFGIAKTSDALALTSSGMIVGTPAYMSPEHFNGGVVGPSADQYALGCVAYELLTGSRPFERRTLGEVMKAHLLDEPTPILDIDLTCPPKLAGIIHRMIAKDAGHRFPSLAAVVHELGVAEPEQQRSVTTHIVKLAKSGEEHRPRISQPISPVPSSAFRKRPTSGSVPAVHAGEDHATRSLVERWGFGRLMIGANAAVILLAFSIWLWVRGPNGQAGASEPDRPEVSVPSTGGPPVQFNADSNRAPDSAKPSLQEQPPVKKTEKKDPTTRIAEKSGRVVPQSDLSKTPVLRDSIVPTAPSNAPAAPDTQPQSMVAADSATVTIGSRTPGAVLYVDNTYHSTLYGKKLVPIKLLPGTHRIVVTVQDCSAPFDTTVTLAAGEKLNLNYRNPPCELQ